MKLRFDSPYARPISVVSPKVHTRHVLDIRVPLGKYQYIGPVYDSKRKDRFFTGREEKKQWRIVVDKRGIVYKLETKLNNIKRR